MSRKPEQDIRTWPRGLAEIAKLIGPARAVDLADKVGGVATYIPKHPTETHTLAGVVGIEALEILSRAYGGQTIIIPRGVYCNLKKAAILAAEGSRKQVAQRLGVTGRYVQRVRNDAKPEQKVQDLFSSIGND